MIMVVQIHHDLPILWIEVSMSDFLKIEMEATKQIHAEEFQKAVDLKKQQLRNKKSIWDKVFPWRIMIIRKDKP